MTWRYVLILVEVDKDLVINMLRLHIKPSSRRCADYDFDLQLDSWNQFPFHLTLISCVVSMAAGMDVCTSVMHIAGLSHRKQDANYGKVR